MMKMILALDELGGLGKDGSIPWPFLKGDMKNFVKETKGTVCIMGRKTFDSLPKPLSKRIHIVVTKNIEKYTRDVHWDTLNDFISPYGHAFYTDSYARAEYIARLFFGGFDISIIGGKSAYEYFGSKADEIILTRVCGVYDCDVALDMSDILEEYKHLGGRHLFDEASTIKYTIDRYSKSP